MCGIDDRAVLESRDAGNPGFALIDLAAGSVQHIASPTEHAEYLAGSVEAGAILFRHSHANGADLIVKHADGRQTVVDRLNEHLAAVAKTEWMTITHTVDSPVGRRELESCVLLPPDYDPGRRYPVIVEVYPSRGANCTSPAAHQFDGLGRRSGPYSEHLLTARGYIVFKPNTSREVTRTESGPLGGMTDIVLQGVDALIEQGYADEQRIGLMGFSQGGFSSLWVASQTGRFRAVVSLNSWADMYGHYFDATYLQRFYTDESPFNGSAERYESTAGTDFSIGSKPFEDPDAYVRNSPLFTAPSITSPILLIHSDMDTFALAQYERMFTALRLQGKQARFLRYWGEGHGPSSPANIRHMWKEIFQWFDRYVLAAL
jgi:dipeptidyl aminopeptidase/acylaminoacyl peptidase